MNWTSLYNGLITTLIMFYIINYIKGDYTKPRINSYIMSILIFTVFTSLLIVIFPNISLPYKVILNFLFAIFLTMILLKQNIFDSVVSVVLSIIVMGIGDIVAAVIYLIPLKIKTEVYSTSFIHITIGSLIIFGTAFGFLKLVGKKLNAIRKNALVYDYKLMIILASNFIAILILLMICYNIFSFYIINGSVSYGRNTIETGMIFVVMGLLVISGITLYLFNNSIISKLKLEQAINEYCIDELTGVLNRKAGMDALRQQVKLSRQKKQNVTVCYLDINKLKEVNDTYGHKQGDHLIISIIEAIKSNIRKTDKIARFGGDEFVIIFPDYNINEAEIITKRVLSQLENTKWELNDNYKMSFSYGFAECSNGICETVESLLEKADQQMYQFKRAYNNAETIIY